MPRTITKVIFLICLIPGLIACGKADSAWIERYQRSIRQDIDLFLIPEKYAVLESRWLYETAIARFDRKHLVRALGDYGRTLDDLRKNPAYELKEDGEIISMKVGRNSHSTAYDYDTHIPIAFYGKYFRPNSYNQPVYQQHIAPTLAKLLRLRNPNGVEVPALDILGDVSEGPDIVVVAVIDQGGMGLHNTHAEVAPNIQGLFKESAFFTNAHVGHLDAHTAVGHMAIGTGAFPRKSHVIGNTFFSKDITQKNGKVTKSEIYATTDEARVSPEELRSETLGDVLNQANAKQSVLISQCYALRASIGMAGHGVPDGVNNYVYWLDSSKSAWVTDSRYYAMPAVVRSSDVMLNYAKYYPRGFEGYPIRDRKSAQKNWGVLMSTPAETQLEGELLRAVITQEILLKNKGKDGFADLAYVTFKSADAVGHHFGYHSLEARATLAAIDEQIGRLLAFLREKYGDRFALVLTADHGMAPLSEISGGARLTVEEVVGTVDTLLPKEIAENESLVRFMTVGQISLNHDLMEKHKISERMIMEKIMSMRPGGRAFFHRVLTRKDLIP